MSHARFAPITGSLLARKGEAAPSLETKRPMDWMIDSPRDFAKERTAAVGLERLERLIAPSEALSAIRKPRRIMVSLSDCEFERLGIAAVKKGVSRHDLVRDTMNLYLDRLATEMNGRCACLADGSRCCGAPGTR